MVVWQGVSQLDGVTPIVVLATYDTRGGDSSSQNAKTGGMVQTFVLRDDVDPLEAKRLGLDEAICGTCPHRARQSGGSDACYVNVGQAPLSTWRAYKRDGTREAKKARSQDSVPFDVNAFAGRKVRIGSYGDPGAVPVAVWQAIVAVAGGVTGYTHAWKTVDPAFAGFAMASADSVAEGRAARALGYRSFIVRGLDQAKPRGAIVCPASAEAGKKTVCASCLQCGGTSARGGRDITIVAHGSQAGKFRLPLTVA